MVRLPMENEVEKRKALRSEVPDRHCDTDDSRLQWLWNQRLETVANVFYKTRDVRTRMAASLMISATVAGDLGAIELLLRRLEGGAISDQEVLESDSMPL